MTNFQTKKRIKSITICSSASFYKQSWGIKKELERLGFKVWVPHTAKVMNRTKNYKVRDYKTWYENPKDYKRKAWLMKKHFDEIEKADAILVINLKKKGLSGYIGGNLLMEMGLAFYLKKPIFVWNSVPKNSPFYEEVMGMKSVFINQDLSKIK